jgi:lipoate-protein ligase A
VLGCSQHALRTQVETQLAGRAAVVERDSGGKAVLAGPWLVSVSLVLPPGHAWVCNGLIDSYRRLGQLHVAALEVFGVHARAVSPLELPTAMDLMGRQLPGWACFGGLSPWELVSAQGRKLVGLAQRRQSSGVLLVSGTLIGRPDWALLCDALGQPQDEQRLRECTVCAEALAGPEGIDVPRYVAILRSLLEPVIRPVLA